MEELKYERESESPFADFSIDWIALEMKTELEKGTETVLCHYPLQKRKNRPPKIMEWGERERERDCKMKTELERRLVFFCAVIEQQPPKIMEWKERT